MNPITTGLPVQGQAASHGDEFSLPRHPALKLAFWTSTALFVGISLGLLLSQFASFGDAKCAAGDNAFVATPAAH